jgi:hypothetical protein
MQAGFATAHYQETTTMRRLTFLIVGLLVSSLLLVGTPHQTTAQTYLRADMASLDRAYIAALALTSQEKVEPSRRAMAVLVPTWQGFKAKYAHVSPADAQWSVEFDDVDGRIHHADAIVTAGTALLDAHEELEGVRFTFMELRERNGIEYYVDDLTRFHAPMEAIVLAAKDKSPDTFTPADLAIIKAQLPEAQAVWQRIATREFDAALFGFPESKLMALQTGIGAETEALVQLERAIDAGDMPAIIKRSVAIKPGFAALFMLFGDFETVT